MGKNYKMILIGALALITIGIYIHSQNKSDSDANAATVSSSATTDDGISTPRNYGGNKAVDSNTDATEDETDAAYEKNSSARKGIELPAYSSNDMIVEHKSFILSYNTEHNTPNWVAWSLTGAHANGSLSRSKKFWADEKIPTRYRVNWYEYKESGYDRGHMCPAGDNAWNAEAMHDCFYMSNMCPQEHELNNGSWKKLEEACRRWAVTEKCIYICCGPIYKGNSHSHIGQDHRIDVPEGFFKVVLSLRKGKEKAIGFYYENNERNQSMRKVATTVDAIEKMTGYDFFHALDDNLEKKVESEFNLGDWGE